MTSEQAKEPADGRLPPEWGKRWIDATLEVAGVLAFAAFATWSCWQFVTYTVPRGAGVFEPNSLQIHFTPREYLDTFGAWRGFGQMPRGAWTLWGVWVFGVLLMATVLRPNFGAGVPKSLLVAALLGTLGLDFFVSALWPRLYVLTPIGVPFLTAGFVLLVLLLGGRFGLRSMRSIRPRVRWRRGLAVRIGLALLLTLAFLSASTPPIQSDGLRYHLAAPAVWVERGSMEPIAGMAFSQFPFLIEMWFVAALRHSQPIAAKLFHLLFFLVALTLVAGFTRRLALWAGLPARARRGLPLLAVAVAATMPAFTIVSTWEFIDAGVVCFHVGALFALALWWHSGRGSQLVLAAMLTGFLLGTKYTALIPAFVLGLGVLLHGRPVLSPWRYTPLERLANALVFAAIAVAIGSPWYLRNWVQLQNPVYPLANAHFQAPGWDAESQALWESKASEKGVGFEWPMLGESWWGSTFRWAGPARAEEPVRRGGFEDQTVGLTPWLLAPLGVAGLVLLAMTRGGWWWFHLIFIAVSYGLWFRTYQSNRLLLPTLVCALPAAVVGLGQISRGWRSMGVAAVIALSLAGAYQGLWIVRHFMTEEYPLQLALGHWAPEDWLSRRLNCFDASNAVRALVPAQQRALVIGEARRFGFPSNVVMSDWFDPPAVRRFVEGAQSSAEVSARLASEEITHVLISHAELLAPAGVSGALLRADGSVDAGAFWGGWARGESPQGSNAWYFRQRFSEPQARALADWLSTVPHTAVWRGDQAHTRGVELWRLEGHVSR